MKQSCIENDRLLPVETPLIAPHDEELRRAHVEELQARIAAGTYQINSTAIAQSLLESPIARKTLGIE